MSSFSNPARAGRLPAIDADAQQEAEASAEPLSIEALFAFQDTMRQFLQMQERVLQQFLHASNTARNARQVGTAASISMPPVAALAPATTAAALPLIRSSPVLADGAFTYVHLLTAAADPYLADHTLDAMPVLPMAVALEYMAEFAAACWPGRQVIEIRDLQLLSGLAIDDAGCEIELRTLAATPSTADLQAVSIELRDRKRRSGPNYRATVLLSATLPEPPVAATTPTATTSPMAGAQIYASFLFHGPCFQCVQQLAPLDDTGLAATVVPSSPSQLLGRQAADRSGWLFDPALIDAAPQLAWVWSFTRHDAAALPIGMTSVRRYGSAPISGPLQLIQRLSRVDDDTLRYVAEYVDTRGYVRYAISAGASTMSARLNRLVPASPDFRPRHRHNRSP